MNPITDEYYAAVLARDYRFDGKFFLGVKTTGIYCRPICPAKPKRKNVEFFDSAALAEKAGYRPCLRCRPEAAPLSPAWYGKSALVQRALRRIIEVGLQEEHEEAFAAHFGITSRHLRRLFVEEIGKTPKQFYQEQRLNLARKMTMETQIPITEIAFATGFHSLRRFNDAFQSRFSRSPSALRKSKSTIQATNGAITLWLSYRPPFQFEALLAYLKRHEIQGVEEISESEYVRYHSTKTGMSRIQIRNHSNRSALAISFDHFDKETLYGMVQNVRRLFDLDADPLLVSTAFERSSILKYLDEQNKGIRSPGSWDPFETAIGIILGQLVSNEQARNLIAQLVLQFGMASQWEGKTVFSFPTPRTLATADLSNIRTTQKRRETIALLSQKIASGEIQLSSHQEVNKIKHQLLQIPGIGPWTVEYIGMRCLRDPDSFPSSDLILNRTLVKGAELKLHEVRPWRSYAAYLLWESSVKKPKKI